MKKITRFALTLLIVHCTLLIEINAQVGINNDNSDPDASAMMDVKSSDKGMLVPRMDSTARNSILNPAVGLLVYDSTTTSFWYYDEIQWNEIRNSSQTISIQDLVYDTGDCLEEKGSLDIMFSTSNMVLDSNFAYVIGGGNLKIIDITNPNQLVESGSIATTSSARYIDVANNYAYTVDENQEAFNVIDVSDVNNLNIVGTLTFGTDPLDVLVSGNYAYVIDPGIGIIVIDVSDPMNPTQVNTFGLGSGPNGMALADDYLYVVDRNSNDLRIINISNPLALSLTGSLIVGNSPTAVAVLGDYAYVVDSNSDDLKVINVSNPASPVLNGSLSIGGRPSSVAVTGNTVYVVDTDSDDIKAIDVSDPNLPILEASLSIGTNPNVVVTDGSFAYVVDSGSDDLKSIAACNELLSVNGATGEVQTTSIEEITAIETIKDADDDTKIQVEETEDEDVIRVDIAGEEKFVFTKTSNSTPRLEFISPINNFSIFIGDDEVGEMSTGQSNIAIGNQALRANTSGRENIAIGTNALFKNSNSIGNYAIGHGALNENFDGNNNVAIASGALRRNTSGSGNIGIGASAGFYNTTGNNNILIGESAGGGFNSEHAKSNNVMIGDEAGLFNQGSGNVFLGYNAGYGEDGSNKLYIENSSANANNTLIYGEFDNNLVRINGDLEVTGSFPGTDDQSLSFDGTNLSIEDGNSVNISSIDTDTDDQTLSFDGTNLSIADGNSVDISSVDTDTDNQTIDKLNLNGTTLELSLEDDGEVDQTVDLASIDTDTDDQTLSFDGTNLSIADGNSVNISSVDTDTDNQTIDKLNLNGTTLELSLEDDGEVDQTVDLASIDTDDQTLSFNNTNKNLSIAGGNTVDLTGLEVPIGTIIMWPSETLPAGWIPCNGQPFVQSTYPELFDILGDNGDGTANVPNFRGRFPLGIGNSQTTYSTNHAIKSTGGFEKHKLTENEMPSHTHNVTVTFDEGQENGSNNTYSDLRGGNDESKTYTSASAGGDVEHNNMPPFYTINFIIKAE